MPERTDGEIARKERGSESSSLKDLTEVYSPAAYLPLWIAKNSEHLGNFVDILLPRMIHTFICV